MAAKWRRSAGGGNISGVASWRQWLAKAARLNYKAWRK